MTVRILSVVEALNRIDRRSNSFRHQIVGIFLSLVNDDVEDGAGTENTVRNRRKCGRFNILAQIGAAFNVSAVAHQCALVIAEKNLIVRVLGVYPEIASVVISKLIHTCLRAEVGWSRIICCQHVFLVSIRSNGSPGLFEEEPVDLGQPIPIFYFIDCKNITVSQVDFMLHDKFAFLLIEHIGIYRSVSVHCCCAHKRTDL